MYAPAALKQVMSAMSALVVEDASIAVSILGSRLDEDGIVADPAISRALREALHALRATVLRLKSKAVPC